MREPLGPSDTSISKTGMAPCLLGASIVNWIWEFNELTKVRNCWVCSAFWMTEVLSLYLSQILRGLEAVLMALTSSLPINRLATKGLMGEPMTTSCPC